MITPTLDVVTSSPASHASQPSEHGELPVDEVLRNAKPYPFRDELVNEDLTDEEEDAFWEAITA
ncbi:MAG: hypothetical protein ACRDZW_05260 [Acidimicrobiales bacterium]